ncbi:cytosine deaminase [Aphanothece sacrum FPU1]|uniref:Cytosine deaminase n=1 Tax=Aphanothece sacrum FPU1 TaxID=1920663 RepID=A0A401IJQ4_APHSA|nr:cytosine deaminase [Aphanothece sacrum FPU1]GBF86336.1 cytosine deaminase [Aphanothece sacrum FPU3]
MLIIPVSDRFWLKNAHIPHCLLENINLLPYTREGLCLVDLEIVAGKITQICPTSSSLDRSGVDVNRGIIFPCFVDIHTHLDKGHIWQRSPNLTGTFDDALNTVKKDAQLYWKASDLYRRMEFGLKCSYAHGTMAIRTHLDSFGQQSQVSFEVFKQLQQEWHDKLILQAVCLVSLDYFLTPDGEDLANRVAEYGGILGGVAYQNPDLDRQLDKIFTLAKERDLDLDFHADETNDPNSICLQKIAEASLGNKFTRKIICGHCCSLAVQSPEQVNQTITLVKEANISIVSLPMCNLYLQDRNPNITPYWRGITKIHEFKKAGVTVAFASDNCRDPFYGFGDHDGLEVLKEAVRIAHLDTPYDSWCANVNQIPADLMGLDKLGRIKIGLDANLIIFKARYFSELFSRPQSDRLILRQGKLIDSSLPDYRELDDLMI